MDEKLKTTINKIVQLSKQNPEFDTELRKAIDILPSGNFGLTENERLNQIYEYCIEEIVSKQALDFYQAFPINEIKAQLQYDFQRMEMFRRKNNFGDFCLSVYQQIECITNYVCNDAALMAVTEKMWAYPTYIENTDQPKLENRVYREDKSCYAIAHLLFYGKNEKGQPLSIEKSSKHLKDLQAIDKIRNVVYFIGYKAEMVSWMYKGFNEICNLLYDLYQCRNLNHRGIIRSERVQNVIDKITPLESLYYFKFYGLLVQYVEFIKEGFPISSKLIEYANSLPSISVTLPKQELKQVGMISLEELERRMKR
jgi:hypothetical protein